MRRKKREEDGLIPRTVYFDVMVVEPKPGDPQYDVKRTMYGRVMDSILLYRHASRWLFTLVAMANFLGGKVRIRKIKDEKKEKIVEADGDEVVFEEIIGEPGDVAAEASIVEPAKKNGKKKSPPQEYLQVVTDFKRAKALRELIAKIIDSGKGKPSMLGYEFRSLILHDGDFCATWMSHMWDSLREEVKKSYISKDPKLTWLNRAYLLDNFKRRLGEFNRVGLPVMHGKRKHVELEYVKNQGMLIRARWDNKIGEVTFRIIRREKKGKPGIGGAREAKNDKRDRKSTLDAGRWLIWRHMTCSEPQGLWPHKTIRIVEKKGRIGIQMSYRRPREVDAGLNAGHRLVMLCNPSNPGEYFSCKVEDGIAGGDEVSKGLALVDAQDRRERPISVMPALDQMDGIQHYDDKLDMLMRGCGSKWACGRGFGHRKAYEHYAERRNRLSKHRRDACRTWNHIWTKDMVHRAVHWKCGKVVVQNLPSDIDEVEIEANKDSKLRLSARGLRGKSWQWRNFRDQLKAKADQAGMTVEYEVTPDAEQAIKAIAVA